MLISIQPSTAAPTYHTNIKLPTVVVFDAENGVSSTSIPDIAKKLFDVHSSCR